jgi:ABC-type sugar transport system ATPase subunit
LSARELHGAALQSYELYPTMSVFDNIGFALEMRKEHHGNVALGGGTPMTKGGVLQQLGTPDEIYNRPVNTYVTSFIGSSTMNLVPGHNSTVQGVNGF